MYRSVSNGDCRAEMSAHACKQAHMHMHARSHTPAHRHTQTGTRTHITMHPHSPTHSPTHPRPHARMHARTYTYTYTRTHVHMHTLKAAKRLARHAVMRADHAKSSSFTDAKMTPVLTHILQHQRRIHDTNTSTHVCHQAFNACHLGGQ